MSKKKLFSDQRWTEPIAYEVVGEAEVTKEDEIECVDFLLKLGVIDNAGYQRRIDEINEKYSNEKSGDENADDK